MRAHFPRCFVDVNREPYELDPRMFEGRLPRSPIPARCGWPVAGNRRACGRRRAGNLRPAHPVDDALRRIESLYKPYPAPCAGCLRGSPGLWAAMLIDCHSMPSTTGDKDERPRPEFVLGDR